MASWSLGQQRLVRLVWQVLTAGSVLSGLLMGATASSALTLDPFATRFEGNIAGDFAMTGNTVLTCSTSSVDLGASSCAAARKRQGALVDNDDHYMRAVETPLGGLPETDIFNSSANAIRIPSGSHILYAELFWSGSMLADAGDIAAPSPAAMSNVLLAVGDEDCTTPINHCQVTAQTSDVVQEMLGADAGQYRASAVVTARLQEAQWTSAQGAWQSLVTVGNIQTTQGPDKAAGWSLALVFIAPGHTVRHVQVLGGFGVVARRSGATVPIDGFLTPSRGDVSSSLGLIAFDGDLGDATDSIYLRQGSTQTVIEDAQNPENNIANSTVSSGGTLATYLSDVSVDRSSNTFGVDSDQIDLTNALAHGSTQASVVMSTQQDTWYPVGLAYSTELPSADVNVLKYVSDVAGAPATEVNVGDTVTYTLRVSNVGNGPASDVVISDEIPADVTVTSTTGTDCATVPLGQVCKVISALSAGGTTEITITGTVNGASLITPAHFQNQAVIHYTSHLGNNFATSNVVTTEYGPLAVDLMSEVAFSHDYIQAGDEATVFATVTNLGPTSDDNPTAELLLTQGAATVTVMPAGCVRQTATRITCVAAAFGVNALNPLEPGDSKMVGIRIRPDSHISTLVVKHIVHTGVAQGDSDPTNNISYARLAVNHPPTARPIKIVARMGGTSVTAFMSSHVSDPDDDALHIRVASTQYGSLIQLGARISYTPPAHWSGVQRVAYTVSDGKGGLAQSHITIVVMPPATATPDSGQIPAPGPRKCFVVRAGC